MNSDIADLARRQKDRRIFDALKTRPTTTVASFRTRKEVFIRLALAKKLSINSVGSKT
jgi:hypothetical protein